MSLALDAAMLGSFYARGVAIAAMVSLAACAEEEPPGDLDAYKGAAQISQELVREQLALSLYQMEQATEELERSGESSAAPNHFVLRTLAANVSPRNRVIGPVPPHKLYRFKDLRKALEFTTTALTRSLAHLRNGPVAEEEVDPDPSCNSTRDQTARFEYNMGPGALASWQKVVLRYSIPGVDALRLFVVETPGRARRDLASYALHIAADLREPVGTRVLAAENGTSDEVETVSYLMVIVGLVRLDGSESDGFLTSHPFKPEGWF